MNLFEFKWIKIINKSVRFVDGHKNMEISDNYE